MSADARDERVEVRQPVSWSSKVPASVIIRPIPLPYLAELLNPEGRGSLAPERRRFADELVLFNTRDPVQRAQEGKMRAAGISRL
jgi:hypothetical protein